MVVTPADAFNELLSLPAPDASTVRRVLRADASALSDVDAAALAAVCGAPRVHWGLDYAVGYDDAQEPSDEDWSTADLWGTAGSNWSTPRGGGCCVNCPPCWRPKRARRSPRCGPVALVPIGPAEVFARSLPCSL